MASLAKSRPDVYQIVTDKILELLDKGTIPWHSKEEFKHFKSTTIGYPILMGRNTFKSLGKPLKNRLNIIITRNPNNKYEFEELKYFSNLNDAYNFCQTEKYEQIFIIGGGEIYKTAMNDADELIISVMKFEVNGDTFFPEISQEKWEITAIKETAEFSVYYYSRKN